MKENSLKKSIRVIIFNLFNKKKKKKKKNTKIEKNNE